MKLTKSQLKQIVKEELKQSVQERVGDPGYTPTVDELASGYWNAALQGRSNLLDTDLNTVWNPLAKGQEVDPSALSSTTEFVSGMKRSDLRHYAQNVQNALMNLLKDILRDEAPPEMAKQIGPGEQKLAQKLLQKLFGEVDVNPAYRAQVPGMQEGKTKLTNSQLKQIIKEEISKVLNEKQYLKDFARGSWHPSNIKDWMPEHIRKNKDLWRAALQAHQNPSPTPEDTRTIQALQQSLASFEAGEDGSFGANADVKGLILFVLEEYPYFIGERRNFNMKLTNSQLKQLIKEELLDELGAQEENQPLVTAANKALHVALVAITDLSRAVEKGGFQFNTDSPVTLADLDYKIVKLNRILARLNPPER